MTERTRPQADGLDNFFSTVVQICDQVCRAYRQEPCEDTVESALVRLEACLINLQRVGGITDNTEEYERLVSKVNELYDTFKEESLRRLHDSARVAYVAPSTHNGAQGRPTKEITKPQLEFLLGHDFHVTTIASMVGVSRQTVHRRMRHYNLSVSGTYDNISDDELDDKVRQIVNFNRNLGYRSVRSKLDVKVPYERVRKSIIRVDPVSVALRFGNTVQRRNYSVTGPNALWHIDGNHKLIGWKFVIHGGICGGTRCIPFMCVSGNNRADTVLSAFRRGEAEFGLPSRIRVDNGGENRRIVDYMEERLGRNRGSAIIGRSVHNQRIERLWRDVFQGVLCKYYDLFVAMERNETLDTSDQLQMFSLHYAFLPLIQRDLDLFRVAYNRHPLQSEGHSTPTQLFIRGVFDSWNNPHTGARNFRGQLSNNNDEQPVAIPERVTTDVHVPAIPCPLADAQMVLLKEQVDPLRDSADSLGLDVYALVLQFVAANSVQ